MYEPVVALAAVAVQFMLSALCVWVYWKYLYRLEP